VLRSELVSFAGAVRQWALWPALSAGW
jgi:hypothetical protein